MDRGLLAVTAAERPIGTAAAHSFELTLPGGTLTPVAGVTAVGVVPTHRRQGVLTAMMRHQLAEVRARGEFLSVLLSSEAVIYRRFGYGPATYTGRPTVPRHQAVFTVPRAGEPAATGSIELLRRAECGDLLEEIYDRYRLRAERTDDVDGGRDHHVRRRRVHGPGPVSCSAMTWSPESW